MFNGFTYIHNNYAISRVDVSTQSKVEDLTNGYLHKTNNVLFNTTIAKRLEVTLDGVTWTDTGLADCASHPLFHNGYYYMFTIGGVFASTDGLTWYIVRKEDFTKGKSEIPEGYQLIAGGYNGNVYQFGADWSEAVLGTLSWSTEDSNSSLNGLTYFRYNYILGTFSVESSSSPTYNYARIA